ncbi:MFS transporter [Actinocorallia sp. B10E7]|uniref:MFS transporter n=1 Tax=Actinocorallia sp. B10E7 TaxID=3153558 RepID=UPI00325F5DF9
MSDVSPKSLSHTSDEAPSPPHAALALVVIAAAQLMVALDSTITNIALPSIQTDLGMSASGLAWVVNSYALAFGGLLLLGGRSGDIFGRRRMFRIGLAVFTIASLLGGLAQNDMQLIAARILQGVGAAISAPTALSLITVNFPEGKPRNKAMGVYAAMSGMGSIIGLLLGGSLTNYLDWRWVMFINVPIGLVVLAGTKVLAEGERSTGGLDIPGAITGTGGLLAFVYGITRGGDEGWTDTSTLASFGVAFVLLAVFLLVQSRTTHPMMPLRLFADRNRAGSYATMMCIGAGMFATFYFLTLYMQQIHGYGPLKTGLSYLPFSVGVGLATGVGSKLLTRVPPRAIAGPGLVIGACGMFWFSTLEPGSGYFTQVVPAMFLTSVGLGSGFLPMALGAVSGIRDQEAGIASALLNTSQQIGGALGLATLSTVAVTAADDRLPHASETFFKAAAQGDLPLLRKAADALTHGYTTGFLVASLFFMAGFVITVTAINAPRQEQSAPDEAPRPA